MILRKGIVSAVKFLQNYLPIFWSIIVKVSFLLTHPTLSGFRSLPLALAVPMDIT